MGFVLAVLTFGNTCHAVVATLTSWERWGWVALILQEGRSSLCQPAAQPMAESVDMETVGDAMFA